MKLHFSWRAILRRLVVLAWLATLPVMSLWGQQAEKPTQPNSAANSKQETDLNDEMVAIVLGKCIYASDVAPSERFVKQNSITLNKHEFEKRLAGMRAIKFEQLIYQPILEAFVKKHDLSPTKNEINLLVKEFDRRVAAIDEDDGDSMTKFEQQFFERIVLSWKTSKFIFEKHGGSVGLSKFGPSVSFSGRLALLKEQKQLGNFSFQNDADEKLFWNRIKDESAADLVVEGDEAKVFFQTTPWATAKVINDSANKHADRRP